MIFVKYDHLVQRFNEEERKRKVLAVLKSSGAVDGLVFVKWNKAVRQSETKRKNRLTLSWQRVGVFNL